METIGLVLKSDTSHERSVLASLDWIISRLQFGVN